MRIKASSEAQQSPLTTKPVCCVDADMILALFNVPGGDPNEILDVFVLKRIEDHLSFFTLFDQPQRFQHAHLVRDCRFADPHKLGNVKYTKLFFQQDEHDPEPRGIVEHLERLRQAQDALMLENSLPGRSNRFLMVMDSVFNLNT